MKYMLRQDKILLHIFLFFFRFRRKYQNKIEPKIIISKVPYKSMVIFPIHSLLKGPSSQQLVNLCIIARSMVQ
jgi:hypothetical protein